LVYAFIKDTIQHDVKENRGEEIGEEVEHDSRRYISAAGQDLEIELEQAVEGEANQSVDDAHRRDRQEPEDQVIDLLPVTIENSPSERK